MRHSYGSKSELYKDIPEKCLSAMPIHSLFFIPLSCPHHWEPSFSSGLSYLYTFPIKKHMHVYFLISYSLLHKGLHTINGLLNFFFTQRYWWKPLCIRLQSCSCCCFQLRHIPLCSTLCGHLPCFQHSANQTMLNF